MGAASVRSPRTTTFSPVRIEALREKARRIGETSDGASHGWVRSDADPMSLLALFKPLALRPGYVLRAYRYISGEDANGIVYAMAADAPWPEPDECERAADLPLRPPIPARADRKFTRYIEGNRTPRSYLLASILTRELLEFGARRHGCWWGLERLANAPPPGEWTWIEAPPDNWSPTVQVASDAVTVTFYTLDRERITRYTDTYEPGQYSFVTDGAVIAWRPMTSGGSIRRHSS